VPETGMTSAIEQWESFCDGLRSAGREILQTGSDADALSQAEGLRYLTRLLRKGIEKFVEYSDPNDPFLANVYNERLKLGLDNPDSQYAVAYINGQKEYEITGNIGTVHYFNITSSVMTTGSGFTITSVLDSPDVIADADGNFTVHLGGDQREGNWLHLDPESNAILVRQTFADRPSEKEMSFAIRTVSKDAEPVALTMEQSLDRLGNAQAFFLNSGRQYLGLAEAMQQHVNELPRIDQTFMLSLGGDPNYAYFWGSFQIEAGEALLIHFPEVPGTDTWSLCLYDFWLGSLDYSKARINLNKASAIHNDDGSLTIVVSNERPGGGNWLNTLGHRRGYIMSRWINPEKVVSPKTELVRLGEVRWPDKLKQWSQSEPRGDAGDSLS
jgi:hypothetical protein